MVSGQSRGDRLQWKESYEIGGWGIGLPCHCAELEFH